MYRKIVLSVILITALLFANLCPAVAAVGLTAPAAASEDASPVMGDGDTAKQETQDIPSGSFDCVDEATPEDGPEAPDRNLPSKVPVIVDTPANATEEPSQPDEPGEETPPDTVWEEVATMAELANLLWKMEKTGGNIRVTTNLLVLSDITYNFFLSVPDDKRIIVDLGSHTLYVDGTLRVTRGVDFIGLGGEQGLIHVNQGGNARFNSAVVFQAATENDCILYQETGATLLYEHNESSVGKVHREPLPEAEATTFEELVRLAEAMIGSGGTIRVTADLVVPVEEDREYSLPRNPNNNANTALLVDMGEYTLYVKGKLRLQTGVKLIGKGGVNGLVRVKTGGEVNILDAVLQAENGCTIWQEEGAIFTHTPTSDDMGQVHYAKKPVAVPDSYINWKTSLPVAVVLDQQKAEDFLPKMDRVCLYQNGLADNGSSDEGKEISVSWDLEPYREQLAVRERVLITGSYPEAEAFVKPTCLVVFQNGNPAVFLDCWGTDNNGRPGAKVKIELMEPELGCRFEWSQDGENWLSADAVETPSLDGRLSFTVSFPQETPPTYPYYLSAVVDYPDGSTGYSEVLVIERALSQCGSGGNRRGGTGIAPPELPPLGGTEEDNDDGTDGITPDEPDHSGESEGSEPPSGGGTDKPDKTPPPVVNAPIENDRPEQSIPPTETPGQFVPPAGSEPPAQFTPPVKETPVPPLATEPPAIAAVEPSSPHAGQTRDETATSTPSSAGPEPSTSASPRAPDATLAPEPQTTADVQEALAPVVTETETPAQDGGAPSTKTVVQVVAGVIATGGIITLTMTWGSWSERLIGQLRKLLKR